MNNSLSNYPFTTPARVISLIFHPLLMPVYGLVIIFAAPTLYGYIPFEIKKLLFLIALVNNVLLPLSLLPFFIHRKIIRSWAIGAREERIIPLIITNIFYLVTSIIIFRLPVPHFLKAYFFALFCVSILGTAINLLWKVSLHSMGAGVLTAIVLILSFKMQTQLLWYLIPAIIAGSLVLSSRLHLNIHNPEQVWVGFATGFFGLALTLQLL